MKGPFRVSDELHDGDATTVFIPSGQKFTVRAKAELLAFSEQAFAVNCHQFAIAASCLLEHAHSVLSYQVCVEFFVVKAQTS